MHHEEMHHGIDSTNINLLGFIHIAITEHVYFILYTDYSVLDFERKYSVIE